MTRELHELRAPDVALATFEPRLPRWVDEALGPHASSLDLGPELRGMVCGPLAVLTTTIAHASDMPAQTLRTEVARAYRRVGRALTSMERKPIRFWNYIPSIDAPMGDGLNRYMVFNSGRYDAVAPAPDRADELFGRSIATASAVGIGGTDLMVHCLASHSAGLPVENPRQISSWRYSARFGPVPPFFSRATIATLNRRTMLLIGGTASVVGEQSLHQGDMKAQLCETLRNLSALVSASRDHTEDTVGALERLVDLRVYATSDAVADFVQQHLAARCPNARHVEIVRARVCRPELLLEIEGIGEM